MIKKGLEQTRGDFEGRLNAFVIRQKVRREKLDYMHEGAFYSYVEGLRYTKTPKKEKIKNLRHTETLKQEQTEEKYIATGFYAFVLSLIAFICVLYAGIIIGPTLLTGGILLMLLFMIDPAAAIIIYGAAFLAVTIASWLIENEESPICPKNSHQKRKNPTG